METETSMCWRRPSPAGESCGLRTTGTRGSRSVSSPPRHRFPTSAACRRRWDGDWDLVAARGSAIDWLENNGTQTFTSHAVFLASDLVFGILAADVDRDGDLDLLSASRNDRLAWHENDGQENFTTRTVYAPGNGTNSVFAADMDGDLDLDILAGRLTDDTIAWFETTATRASRSG